jgi:hypothetical protein
LRAVGRSGVSANAGAATRRRARARRSDMASS